MDDNTGFNSVTILASSAQVTIRLNENNSPTPENNTQERTLSRRRAAGNVGGRTEV